MKSPKHRMVGRSLKRNRSRNHAVDLLVSKIGRGECLNNNEAAFFQTQIEKYRRQSRYIADLVERVR